MKKKKQIEDEKKWKEWFITHKKKRIRFLSFTSIWFFDKCKEDL